MTDEPTTAQWLLRGGSMTNFADLYTCYVTGQMDVARYYQLRREQPLFARWVDRHEQRCAA